MIFETIVYSVLVWPIDFCGAYFVAESIKKFLPEQKNKAKNLIAYLMFMFVLVHPAWIGDENSILLFPFMMFVFIFCYSGGVLAKLALGGIFYSLQIPLNMMVDSMINFHGRGTLEDLVRISIKTLLWFFIFLYLKKIGPEKSYLHLTPRLWGIVVGLILMPVFVIFAFSSYSPISTFIGWSKDEKIYDTFVVLGYLLLPWITLFSLMILNAIVILGKYEQQKIQYQLTSLREMYYEGLKHEQMQVRTLRHDMRNHITVVQNMLQKGNAENAAHYLKEITESEAIKGKKHFCENEIADIVLISKAEVMEKKGIAYEMIAQLPQNLPISETDICSLLGNVLDNAIEAVEKMEEKKITIHARVDKGMFMLRVENPIKENIVIKNNKIETTKKNKKEHGFGILGIKDTIEKNAGTLQIESKDGKFELIAYIPIINS